MRSHADAEQDKKFNPQTTFMERLNQAWWLTCLAYGIDPKNPPKMKKELTYAGKHR